MGVLAIANSFIVVSLTSEEFRTRSPGLRMIMTRIFMVWTPPEINPSWQVRGAPHLLLSGVRSFLAWGGKILALLS